MRVGTTLWAALAGCSALLTAAAQPSPRPWTLSAGQNWTHESNVLNGPRGSEQSDTVSTTTLSGGLDLTLGRQRAYANGSFNHQNFRHLSARNNDGYALAAGLTGATVGHLSGSLKFMANRRQADFNVGGVTPVSISNIERSEEVAVNLGLGGVGLLGLDLGAGQRKVSFSALEFASRAYAQDSARLSLAVRPSGIWLLSLGLGGDRTRFEAPAPGQTRAENSRREDVFVSAVWLPSGLSTVSLRLASSRVQYERSAASNFEGLTGSLAWNWKPTGRLTLNGNLTRESGQESGFLRLNGGASVSATDFSQLSNTQGLRATFDASGKVEVSAALAWAQRGFVDGATAASSSDKNQSLTVGARWAATRTLAMTCAATRDERTGSSVNLPSYVGNRVGCTAQLSLD